MASRNTKRKRSAAFQVGGVVLAIVLIVGLGIVIGQTSKKEQPSSSTGLVDAGDSAYSFVVGDPDAPHQVIVYEDFLCPICDQLEQASSEDLQQLADEGKVYLDYRPFNLFTDSTRKPYSVAAATVWGAVVTTQDETIAKRFHDLLFDEQPSETGPFPAQDDLLDLAQQAGADRDAVEAALDQGKDWVDGATQEALDAGVTGTPTIILDGNYFSQGGSGAELGTNLVAAVGR